MITKVGDLTESVPCVSIETKNHQVDELFKTNSTLQGIVVLNNNHPIALITRSQFYQKIGTLYGYNLYMGRQIDLLTKNDPLIVDYFETITKVSHLAMHRNEENLYDYVIVTKDSLFNGVISIRNLLIKFAEIQTKMATFLNPLTGLPGNHMIELKLKEMLLLKKFSVLYIDLDHFKAYNDTYGFKKGDALLQATAKFFKQYFDHPPSFLGHIGGDDFIAILNHYHIHPLCREIVSEFDQLIKNFYSKEHLEQKYVIAENRYGNIEKIPLVSISIAAVTDSTQHFLTVEEIIDEATRLKKICKSNPNSCYFVNSAPSFFH